MVQFCQKSNQALSQIDPRNVSGVVVTAKVGAVKFKPWKQKLELPIQLGREQSPSKWKPKAYLGWFLNITNTVESKVVMLEKFS